MLKINNNLSSTQSEVDSIKENITNCTSNDCESDSIHTDSQKILESTVIVENDHSNISVDTIIQKETNSIYVGTVVKDNYTGSEVHINTVLINNISKINCCQIVAKNNSNTTTRWILTDPFGKILYTSNYYPIESTCVINLNATQIKPGTRFKLKALVSGKIATSCIILEFTPISNKCSGFILKKEPDKFDIRYLGVRTRSEIAAKNKK